MPTPQGNRRERRPYSQSRYEIYLDGARFPEVSMDEIQQIREDAKTDPVAKIVYERWLRTQEHIKEVFEAEDKRRAPKIEPPMLEDRFDDIEKTEG